MNYYGRNIGDYARDAKHLDFIHHGAYTVLLDYYYSIERPIPGDIEEIYRKLCAKDDAERHAIDDILAEFFTLGKRGYRQKRADEEIKLFRDKSESARASIRKRWDKEHTNVLRSNNDGNTNHNQEPITKKHNQEPLKPKPIEQVQEQFDLFWMAWPKGRRICKVEAIKAWSKIPGIGNHVAEIILSVEKWKCTEQWQDPKHIPYPATFINRRQWEGEVPLEAGNGKQQPKSAPEQRIDRGDEAIANVLGAGPGMVARDVSEDLRSSPGRTGDLGLSGSSQKLLGRAN